MFPGMCLQWLSGKEDFGARMPGAVFAPTPQLGVWQQEELPAFPASPFSLLPDLNGTTDSALSVSRKVSSCPDDLDFQEDMIGRGIHVQGLPFPHR